MVEITRVICPVDFSEPSEHAFRHAIAVARWWGATLTVLHVYTPVPEVVPALEPAGLGIDGGDDPDLHPPERVTSEFARRAGADPQTTRVVVRVGWPADEIVTYAGAGED